MQTMAMGRTWQESLQKALRGMETGLDGWALPKGYKRLPKDELLYKMRVPNPDRIHMIFQVMAQAAAIAHAAAAEASAFRGVAHTAFVEHAPSSHTPCRHPKAHPCPIPCSVDAAGHGGRLHQRRPV
jgi:hypothetical protein